MSAEVKSGHCSSSPLTSASPPKQTSAAQRDLVSFVPHADMRWSLAASPSDQRPYAEADIYETGLPTKSVQSTSSASEEATDSTKSRRYFADRPDHTSPRHSPSAQR
jgi:hypothetical protein